MIYDERHSGAGRDLYPDPNVMTQAETTDELQNFVRDAVHCHFDEGQGPDMIRLHFVKDEVIGTLASILADVAAHGKLNRDDWIRQLWG